MPFMFCFWLFKFCNLKFCYVGKYLKILITNLNLNYSNICVTKYYARFKA